MSLLGQVDAFLEQEEALDREQLREWLPELLEIKNELEVLYYPRAQGLHSRPDVEICRRLTGIRRLIGKAKTIGVEDGDDWILYAPLEA